MFRVLTPGASDDDIRIFGDISQKSGDAAYQESVDNIYQVSVSANEESYDRLMKEESQMCEALRKLMKDEFAETEARGIALGEARGEARGEIKGAVKTYSRIGKRPSEIISLIINDFSINKETAEKYVEEVLGLQPA